MNIRTAQVIREEEGTSLEVYQDHLGNLTVGVGHKIVPKDKLELGDTISDACCTSLFIYDLKRAEDGAAQVYHGASKGSVIFHILTCMVFQMGVAGVLKFKKMLAALKDRDYAGAAKEMLDSLWAKQTPERAQRLADEMRGLAHAGS